MKRLLALLLCAVMLFSVLGAEVWAADGDTLTVYAKSGGRRNVRVGDTVTYSYALKLTGIYDLDRVRLDVVFDEECLEFVSVEYPSFRTGDATETVKNGVLHMEKSAITNGGAFSQSISDIIKVTFRAKRAGTTYIRTLPQRIEVEGGKESDIYLIENYRPNAIRDALFSTYDYLGDNVPTNATTKLNTSQDVVWFYIKDADVNPVEAGQRFLLSGTDENGKIVSFSAETDEYGFVCYPRVAFGNYSIACDSAREDGSAWFVDDASVIIPAVKNGELSIRREVTARLLQPEDMIDLRVSLAWADEFIDRGVPYTNDRPANVSAELEAGGKKYAHAYLSADKSSVVLKNLPRTDAEGNELEYELFPGVTDHYTSELSRTEDGFVITLRYLNDHEWEKVRTEPDCDHSGEVVYTCSDCNAVYHYTLAPLGHDYAESGYDASCEKTGYHLYVCKRCGKWYAETTPALGHRWGEWIVDQEQVGDEDGHMYRGCSVCGEQQEQILAGPNHKHAYETHVVAPTCTEGGYTEEICGCGKSIIVEGSRTNALGHDFTGNSATRTVIENGCTEDGLVEYTCTRCGEMHAEILPAHGHNYGVVEQKDPTCTQAGYTVTECSYCKDRRTSHTPSLGHDWGDWIIDQPAQTDIPGSKHRVCKRCDQIETAVIPASPVGHKHDFTSSETILPTCTEQGYTKYYCACGVSVVEPDSYVDALGHDWVLDSSLSTESTQRTRGVRCFRCSRCGLLRYEFMPKKEGTWKNTFWDVPTYEWFYDAVKYVSYNDYMNGTSSSHFDPNEPMTRAMLVTVLYRIVGSPSVRDLSMPFTDVPNEWYHDAVLWAYDTGVVRGVSDTEFAPMNLITREQMVTIFHRYAEYAGYDVSDMASLLGFRDANDVSPYAQDSIAWAVAAQIINGVDVDGVALLQPQGTATRAQAAAIIQRFDTWRLK